jgi:hypothetical protein
MRCSCRDCRNTSELLLDRCFFFCKFPLSDFHVAIFTSFSISKNEHLWDSSTKNSLSTSVGMNIHCSSMWHCVVWVAPDVSNNRFPFIFRAFGLPVAVTVRHCATSRNVAVSIPDGLLEILIDIIRIMLLGSTQPLTETTTRNISWRGKGGHCLGLSTIPHSCADFLDIWEPRSPGTYRACLGLHKGCSFALPVVVIKRFKYSQLRRRC